MTGRSMYFRFFIRFAIFILLVFTGASCNKNFLKSGDSGLKHLAFDKNANNIALLFGAPEDPLGSKPNEIIKSKKNSDDDDDNTSGQEEESDQNTGESSGSGGITGPNFDVKYMKPIMESYSFQTIAMKNAEADPILSTTQKYAAALGNNSTMFWYFSGHGGDGVMVTYGNGNIYFSDVAEAIRKGRSTPIKRLYVVIDTCLAGDNVNGEHAIVGSNGSVTGSGNGGQGDDETDNTNDNESNENDPDLNLTSSYANDQHAAAMADSVIRAIVAQKSKYAAPIFEQVIVMASSSKTEESGDEGEDGGTFTKALRQIFAELKNKPNATIKDLVQGAADRTSQDSNGSQNPVYRVYPATGVLEDKLFDGGTPTTVETNKDIFMSLERKTEVEGSYLWVSLPVSAAKAHLCTGNKNECENGTKVDINLRYQNHASERAKYRSELPIKINQNLVLTAIYSDKDNKVLGAKTVGFKKK